MQLFLSRQSCRWGSRHKRRPDEPIQMSTNSISTNWFFAASQIGKTHPIYEAFTFRSSIAPEGAIYSTGLRSQVSTNLSDPENEGRRGVDKSFGAPAVIFRHFLARRIWLSHYLVFRSGRLQEFANRSRMPRLIQQQIVGGIRGVDA